MGGSSEYHGLNAYQNSKEQWSHRKHSISHLHVFGCISFAHVCREKRSKLDAKRKIYMFVGYNEKFKD